MARRKRLPYPKLTKELRTRILHRVQTWCWLSMVGKIPSPLITGESPSQDYLDKYDPEYRTRLTLGEDTLEMLDARGGVDWVAVADAVDRGWTMEFAYALGNRDWIRDWLEDRDRAMEHLVKALQLAHRNPFLVGPWIDFVQEYLRSEDATTDRPRRRPKAGQSKPWVKETEKALTAAGVPEEEAKDLLIALRLRKPRE